MVDIYETPARARVLRAMALASGPHSVRWIARSAGISHTAAGSVLRDLDAMGLVSQHSVGRAHAYELERTNIYVRDMVLPAVAAERHIISELCQDLVDELAADSLSLILFGSYAYGEQNESSDIDVFALADDSLHKQRLEDKALTSSSRLRAKYGSTLSLMVYTRSEVATRLMGGKSSFGTELAVTGIILHGLGTDEWGIDDQAREAEGGAQGRGPEVPGQS